MIPDAFAQPGRVRSLIGMLEPDRIAAEIERNRARYDAPTERAARADFIARHGEAPNAPMTRDRADRLAGGNPEGISTLLAMFGGPRGKIGE